MKFYKCDPVAFLEGTSELTLRQCGAYARLINLLYCRDGIVPDNDYLVARMLNLEIRTWRTVKAELHTLGKVWTGPDGYLKTPRLDDTISEAETVSKTVKIARRSRRDRHEIDTELFGKPKKINGTRLPIQSKSQTQSKEREISLLKGKSLSPEIPSHDRDATFGQPRKVLPFDELKATLKKALTPP